jgi:hypothetical protein
MTMIMSETASKEAAYGWFADAIGGIATVVLAIIGLVGAHSEMMTAIATIVFGAALLVEGGAMATEYAGVVFPAFASGAPRQEYLGGNISAVFTAGIAGIVLGILALIGIHPAGLTAISAIVFGCGLLFSGNAVWRLHRIEQSAVPARDWRSGGEILAGEMAYGSMGTQALAGIAAIVLGIVALVLAASGVLTLVALLVVGAAVLLTGTAGSAALVSFVEPQTAATRSSSSFGPAE